MFNFNFIAMNEFRLLKASEIECRVGQCGKSQKGVGWCSLLLYKDARCDQRLLDETFGIFGWRRKHEVINGQLCCTVMIKDPVTNEWIDKQDVGVESNTEAVKGSFSDAFKRACFNWGLGRELYTAPKVFVTLNTNEMYERNGKWTVNPKCVFAVRDIGYDNERNINVLTIVDAAGKVRYTMGQQVKTEEEKAFDDTLEAYIKPALAQAHNEQDVKAIWDEYTAYQKVPAFVSAITARLNEVKGQAA